MVYFGQKNSGENGQKLAISVMFDTPTSRCRAPPRQRLLHLGRLEPGFLYFLVRLGVAMLRLGVAKFHLGVPVNFVFVHLFR